MSKKKIISLCLAAVLTVTAVAGASLAYLTDTKDAVNTFTVGRVKIDLVEQERSADGTELKDFEQNKKLLPLVGSAQGEKDSFGMPTAKNYVDKMVTVRNTGSEDAYIRLYFAIPSALDDGYETYNAGHNVLHFNFGNTVVNGAAVTTEGTQWLWTRGGKWNYFETTMDDGIRYNVYFADYYKAAAAGAVTEQAIQGVYLDSSFQMQEDGAYAFGQKLTLDAGWDWSKVSCPVFAVACQAGGFDSAAEAITAAFGDRYNPWGGATSNWQ